jgi:hypothetical protein
VAFFRWVQAIHLPFICCLPGFGKRHVGKWNMEQTFIAAIDHINTMEARIRQQTDAIRLLEATGEDTSDAYRRLKLLNFALSEMQTQLAHLAPTGEQVDAPAWTLPFIGATSPRA